MYAEHFSSVNPNEKKNKNSSVPKSFPTYYSL